MSYKININLLLASLAQKGLQLFSGFIPLNCVLNLIISGLTINGGNKSFKNMDHVGCFAMFLLSVSSIYKDGLVGQNPLKPNSGLSSEKYKHFWV